MGPWLPTAEHQRDSMLDWGLFYILPFQDIVDSSKDKNTCQSWAMYKLSGSLYRPENSRQIVISWHNIQENDLKWTVNGTRKRNGVQYVFYWHLKDDRKKNEERKTNLSVIISKGPM